MGPLRVFCFPCSVCLARKAWMYIGVQSTLRGNTAAQATGPVFDSRLLVADGHRLELRASCAVPAHVAIARSASPSSRDAPALCYSVCLEQVQSRRNW